MSEEQGELVLKSWVQGEIWSHGKIDLSHGKFLKSHCSLFLKKGTILNSSSALGSCNL